MALHRRDADIAVFERTDEPDTRGAALSLWPNALRSLDQLRIGDDIRRHAAVGGDSGIRRVADPVVEPSRRFGTVS